LPKKKYGFCFSKAVVGVVLDGVCVNSVNLKPSWGARGEKQNCKRMRKKKKKKKQIKLE
jgi:hypothetical protein